MDQLIKGTVLAGVYEIIEEIGSGGGGIVLKGRHLRLDTDIVIKKVKDEVRALIDVKKEANTLKNLKHQYLPRVYDFIEREDGVYTVMDFIQGENMDAAVRRHGRYPQKQVMKWANQLGQALKYLHSQKRPVIHGDIKPANIMLTPDGDVCLIDFNISVSLGDNVRQATGISIGFSPPEQYFSPELYLQMIHAHEPGTQDAGGRVTAVRGDSPAQPGNGTATHRCTRLMAGRIDARSDVYSLGAALYFMLTGMEPAADFENRIPIGRMNVDIKEGFAFVLEKMMEISPGERYQNGAKYLNALNNCYKLDHEYVRMRRVETVMQAVAAVFLFCGVLALFRGGRQIGIERNNAYHAVMQEAGEAMDLCDYEAAGGLIAKGKDILPARIEAYAQEVHLLYLEEDYAGCIRLCENYIETAPFTLETDEDRENFGDIYYIMGNAYFEMEDYVNAKNMFEYAIGYNRRNSLYFTDYAVTLAKLGQTDEAERQLEAGLRLGLADDSIYMVRGEIAYADGRYQEAAEDLQQAVSLITDRKGKNRAVLLCAGAYRAIGNEALDDEIRLLEQYSGGSGNGSSAITGYLADAYMRKAQADESGSMEYWQKSLQLYEGLCNQGYATYEIWANIAFIYEKMNAFDEAEQMLLAMAESYPGRYETYRRLAWLEAERQQEKAAGDRDYHKMQEYYDKAVERYPDGAQDMEMQMLDIMMQDVRDGGWLP